MAAGSSCEHRFSGCKTSEGRLQVKRKYHCLLFAKYCVLVRGACNILHFYSSVLLKLLLAIARCSLSSSRPYEETNFAATSRQQTSSSKWSPSPLRLVARLSLPSVTPAVHLPAEHLWSGGQVRPAEDTRPPSSRRPPRLTFPVFTLVPFCLSLLSL